MFMNNLLCLLVLNLLIHDISYSILISIGVQSGANNHLVLDLSNFSLQSSYNGPSSVTIGSGQTLLTHHIGFDMIYTSYSQLKLSQILHVMQLSTNLLSVNQLEKDNNCRVIFDSNNVYVQDKQSKKLILHGYSKDDIYHVLSAFNTSVPTTMALQAGCSITNNYVFIDYVVDMKGYRSR